jgi:hypothetical protein
MVPTVEEVRFVEPNFEEVFIQNQNAFNKYNGQRNNCSNAVRKFLSLLGINTDRVTAWADTVRNLGKIIYNPNQLQKGDIVAMGIPGDTFHVGVYFGDGKVLHQSAMRGYKVGVFNDINAFINYHRGFYIVRPFINILENQFFVFPEMV